MCRETLFIIHDLLFVSDNKSIKHTDFYSILFYIYVNF